MTRDDALARMQALERVEPETNVDRFLEMTGLTQGEFDQALDKTPAPYLTGIPRMFNRVRKLIRRQAA